MTLPPLDKRLHFEVGMIIALIISMFFDAGTALMSGILAGICKEILDEVMLILGKRASGGDYMDTIFTIAGTIFGMIVHGLCIMLYGML